MRWGPLNPPSPRSNESNNYESDLPGEDPQEFVNHPEDEDDIFDYDKFPEEKAAADLRTTRRRGFDPNSSLDENNTSFRILDSLTRESNQKEEDAVGIWFGWA